MLKKISSIYLSILFLHSFAFAQRVNNIDSLREALNSYSKSDTNYIQTYLKISRFYQNSNSDSLLAISKKVYKLSEKISFVGGKANALDGIGKYHTFQANYYQAISYFDSAKTLYESIDDKIGIASTSGNIAACYDYLGMYNLSIKYYEQIIEEFKVLKDSFRLGIAYYNIAQTYGSLGKDDISIEYYFQSLRIAESIDDKEGMAWALRSIGQVYREQKQFDKANQNFRQAIQLGLEMEDYRGYVISLLGLGRVFENQGQLDSALVYYQRSLDNAKQNGYNRYTGIAYNRLGGNYHQRREYVFAEINYKKAISILYEIKEMEELGKTHREIAQFYFDLERFDNARRNAERFQSIANEIDNGKMRQQAYLILYQLDSTENKVKEAFQNFRSYISLRDSLSSVEKSRKIRELEIQYETEKREKQLAQQQKRLDMQRSQLQEQNLQLIVLCLSVILMVSISGVFLYGRMKARRNNELLQIKNAEIIEQSEEIIQQREEMKIQAEVLKTTNDRLVELDEYKRVMAGMIVHDLKNPLNIIIGLTDGQDFENNKKKVNQAGKAMLNMVTNILEVQKLEESTTQLSLNFYNLRNLSLEAFDEVRLLVEEKNIQVNINLNESIFIEADKSLLLRVFINLLTNAIKYTPLNGAITIYHSEQEQYLGQDSVITIYVADTGEGIPKEKQAIIFKKFSQLQKKDSGKVKSTGLGLTFCKMAIEAHGQTIGVTSEVGEGATFWFNLKYKFQESDMWIPSIKPDLEQKPVSEDNQITLLLNEEEKEIVAPLLDELQLLEVYELSEVKEVLGKIPAALRANMGTWLVAFEETLYSCNEKRYKELISLIS